MLILLITALACWLLFATLKVAIKIAWGVTKLIVYVLCILAFPFLIICLIFSQSLLMFPLLMLLIAWLIVKCFT